jgi:hypothetical protein
MSENAAAKARNRLSIWQILGVAFFAQLFCILPVLGLQLAGLDVPMIGAFAAGGLLTVFALGWLARRQPPHR